MNRLTILTVIAMVTVATSSGCRTCGSLFNFNRNRVDSCTTCDAGSYESYGPSASSEIIYEGDTMLPPVTSEVLPVLPGPVRQTQ